MKKTNKHPLTFFREANEKRQATVKNSLRKAQDGIETNDDIINKSGSTGGYKKPVVPILKKYMPWKNLTGETRPTYLQPTNPYDKPKPN